METLSFRVSDEWYAAVEKTVDKYDTTQAAVLRAALEVAAHHEFPEDFPENYERAAAPELRKQGKL